MSEWIVGRNPVYEVLRAGRREVYQLRVAQGTEKGGHLGEILKLAREVLPARSPMPFTVTSA